MDFKSHSEFVLPPHKGVKPGKKGSDPVDSPTGLPEPREYHRRASSSTLANDPDLQQTPEPLDRNRGRPEVETSSNAETRTMDDVETAALSGVEATNVDDLVASALDSSTFQSAFVHDDGEGVPPTVVLDDIPGSWEDDEAPDVSSQDEAEDQTLTIDAEQDEATRENAAEEGTAKPGVTLVVPPSQEDEAKEDDDEDDDENDAGNGTNIIEDENVIRAISSVVEKLDRMEDQLKEGIDPVKARPAAAVPCTRQDHRDFIIAYDGSFVGHFRTEKRITNKKAFQKAATALRDKIYDFDPRQLQLFRPVLIKIENPESIPYVDGESFNWFGAPPARVGNET